ncbi:unnamed protein product [Notodromas monacha]|uniref:CUB domain-containing protein n=1 Tax=Notodromas monacha TaxID=399045 RepID=A0A7R9BJU2_9CRUS|nr:unnamed protein product [Notodromas monacha]CAG0916837.1 unnamed protein product [Notodromas monacha]
MWPVPGTSRSNRGRKSVSGSPTSTFSRAKTALLTMSGSLMDRITNCKFCGWQAPTEIRSVSNVMSIVLVSDDKVHVGSRFAAEFEAVTDSNSSSCPGPEYYQLTSEYDYGFVSSPGYPLGYPNGADPQSCSQDFRVGGSISGLALGFLQIRTATGDYVNLNVGNGDYVNRYTGTQDFGTNMPPLFVSDSVKVNLESDSWTNSVGYLVAYASELNEGDWETSWAEEKDFKPTSKPVIKTASEKRAVSSKPKEVVKISLEEQTVQYLNTSTDPKMVNLVTGRNFGFIQSRYHPQDYPNNEYIEYDILAPTGSRIAFLFLRHTLEDCCDHVRVWENGNVM